MADEMDDLTVFIRLSEVLTGVAPLSRSLAVKYMERVQAGLVKSDLPDLLQQVRKSMAAGEELAVTVRDRILPDAQRGPVAREILLLWYNSQRIDSNGKWQFGSPEEFFGALVWRAIGAHPPALSGGYMGHWQYPAE